MYFKITPEQLEKAKHRNTFDKLKNSLRNGEGTYLGSVGEVVLTDYYKNKNGVKFEDKQNYDYDFIINNFKIDVKTQLINFKYKPKQNFTCPIPDFNIKQDCDYYAFMFINLKTNDAYCEGMIKKKDWKLVSKLKKKGEMGFVKPFKCDTWICLVSDLSKIN